MVEFSAVSTSYAVPLDAPRPSDRATSAVRITPPAPGDGLRGDSRDRSVADRAADGRFNGRVAFTAKFGPDPETGLPLQVVRGADVEAAENFDLIAVIDRRIANRLTDGSVLEVQKAPPASEAPRAENDAQEAPAEVDNTDSAGDAFDAIGAADTQPPADFAFPQPAAAAGRGAVLDISI